MSFWIWRYTNLVYLFIYLYSRDIFFTDTQTETYTQRHNIMYTVVRYMSRRHVTRNRINSLYIDSTKQSLFAFHSLIGIGRTPNSNTPNWYCDFDNLIHAGLVWHLTGRVYDLYDHGRSLLAYTRGLNISCLWEAAALDRHAMHRY